jgi:membrane protein implicated in regulation of membrane protease activity
MPYWAIWIVIGVVLLVVEATTMAFVTIYFGVAALVVAALAAAGLPLGLQLVAWAALAVAGLVATRPALRRAAERGPRLVTGPEALRGRIGVVIKEIRELEPGQVRVDGDTWTARSYLDDDPIPAGSRVEVVEVRGITALVIPAPSPRDELLAKEST